MNRLLSRRTLLQASVLSASAMLAMRVRACEFEARNLRILHPWTRATRPGATSAVVGFGIDQVTEPDQLIGLETMFSSGAELGGPTASATLAVPLQAGQDYQFSDEGTFVRLTGLSLRLELGRSYPVSFIFARAGRVAAVLNVDHDVA